MLTYFLYSFAGKPSSKFEITYSSRTLPHSSSLPCEIPVLMSVLEHNNISEDTAEKSSICDRIFTFVSKTAKVSEKNFENWPIYGMT